MKRRGRDDPARTDREEEGEKEMMRWDEEGRDDPALTWRQR